MHTTRRAGGRVGGAACRGESVEGERIAGGEIVYSEEKSSKVGKRVVRKNAYEQTESKMWLWKADEFVRRAALANSK